MDPIALEVEQQIATLRVIPRMSTWRPCDAVESAVAWKAAVEKVRVAESLGYADLPAHSATGLAADEDLLRHLARDPSPTRWSAFAFTTGPTTTRSDA